MRKGIITSRQMGNAFTWMRPDDLVFNQRAGNPAEGSRKSPLRGMWQRDQARMIVRDRPAAASWPGQTLFRDHAGSLA